MFKDKAQDISRAGYIYRAEAAADLLLMDCVQKTWLMVNVICVDLFGQRKPMCKLFMLSSHIQST